MAAVLTAFTSLAAAPALADHGDSGSSLKERDNNDQAVALVDLTEVGHLACMQGWLELDRTEISVSEGTGDIYCYDASYGASGWAGETYCRKGAYHPAKCDEFSISFNYYYNQQSGSNTTVDTDWETKMWKSTGCHEFGHTSSVGHRFGPDDTDNNSCLRTQVSPNRPTYDSHDIGAINGDNA